MKKINWSKQDPVLSKRLSFGGSLILLLAFIVQNFAYNVYNDKLNSFEQANRDFSQMTNSSLLYQSLFMGLETQNDTVKGMFQSIFIQTAAVKYALGKTISANIDLFKYENDKKEFSENVNKLLSLTNNVHDMISLYEFVKEAEELLPSNWKSTEEWIDEVNNIKAMLSNIFFIFQLVGAGMIAMGIRYR